MHETVSALSPIDIQEFHLRLNVAEGDIHEHSHTVFPLALNPTLTTPQSTPCINIMFSATMCVLLDVASVDVDRIAREMDFQALQQNIAVAKSCTYQDFSSQFVPIAF